MKNPINYAANISGAQQPRVARQIEQIPASFYDKDGGLIPVTVIAARRYNLYVKTDVPVGRVAYTRGEQSHCRYTSYASDSQWGENHSAHGGTMLHWRPRKAAGTLRERGLRVYVNPTSIRPLLGSK